MIPSLFYQIDGPILLSEKKLRFATHLFLWDQLYLAEHLPLWHSVHRSVHYWAMKWRSGVCFIYGAAALGTGWHKPCRLKIRPTKCATQQKHNQDYTVGPINKRRKYTDRHILRLGCWSHYFLVHPFEKTMQLRHALNRLHNQEEMFPCLFKARFIRSRLKITE